MLNCHDATRLLSQEQDKKLPITQRYALKLHLLACSGCRAFRHQLDDLRNITQAYTRRDGDDPDKK